MKIKKYTIIVIILAFVFLFFPVRNTYKDGGTRCYSALTYKFVVWNRIQDADVPIYHKTSLFLFPNNLKSIDELWEIEINNR